MKNPPHPGKSIKHDCMEPMGLSEVETAKLLSLKEEDLKAILNGEAGISSGLAIRLDKVFGGGAETWQRLNCEVDSSNEGLHFILRPIYNVKGIITTT